MSKRKKLITSFTDQVVTLAELSKAEPLNLAENEKKEESPQVASSAAADRSRPAVSDMEAVPPEGEGLPAEEAREKMKEALLHWKQKLDGKYLDAWRKDREINLSRNRMSAIMATLNSLMYQCNLNPDDPTRTWEVISWAFAHVVDELDQLVQVEFQMEMDRKKDQPDVVNGSQ